MLIIAKENHWPAIKEIYIEGIKSGNATFEQTCSISDYKDWIEKKIKKSVFIFKENNIILGWSALSHVSDRCVYEGVAEVSVYVAEHAQSRGIGKALLQQLVDFSEENNIWTLQAGIFPENKASIALHKKFGFREVGVREKLGKMECKWRDVILLERRSKKIL